MPDSTARRFDDAYFDAAMIERECVAGVAGTWLVVVAEGDFESTVS
jgi:hypothetical protein